MNDLNDLERRAREVAERIELLRSGPGMFSEILAFARQSRAETRKEVASEVDAWCDVGIGANESAEHPVACSSIFHRIAAAIRGAREEAEHGLPR